MRPNIFDIATKELSQDAFITWLLKFADDKYYSEDPLLNECGKTFAKQLIRKQFPEFNDPIIKISAGRQWENIDVWAQVNDKYLIIIEDKTFTSQHSNQLERYNKAATDWCVKNKYEKPVCIYLKTGNESQRNLNGIMNRGFSIFNRTDFIKLLDKFSLTKNSIFIDFFDRLTRLEQLNNDFANKVIGDWKSADWQGFFQFLEKEIKIVNWHYVNNRSGGFWNAILNWDYWDIYPTYIQIEQGKLCFKISTDPKEPVILPENTSRAEVRNKLCNLILKKSREFGFESISRPSRFGNGKYMTVAVVKRENWLGADDETLEKETVVKTLKDYLIFLKQVIKRQNNAL